MNRFGLILIALAISVCSGSDQKYWNRIQEIVCKNMAQITDEQLSQLETVCKINKEKDTGPISSCAGTKLDTKRDVLKALCDSNTYSCIQKKPLLTESELQSAKNPEQLKIELLDCIENVIKYKYYLFDSKINFN